MNAEAYKYFDLSKVSLQPKTILGLRDSEYIESLFFNHEIYERIRASINDQQVTLVLGNPLSGKTRIVYDALKKNKSWKLIIPRKDRSIEKYILPASNNLLVLLDDIDEYCYRNNHALDSLLRYIINNNLKCIITCRTGPEYNKLKRAIHPNTFFSVTKNRFIIPRFDKNIESVRKFLTDNSDKFRSSATNFDGNFGSVILPLDAMRNRFLKLKEEEKDTALAVLLGLKAHFHEYNYEEAKSIYNDIKIKKFAEKHLQRKISMYEWEETKTDLASTDVSLNFIEVSADIIIEEAYLDFLTDANGNSCDVIYPEFNTRRLRGLINKLYSFEEKKVWGFATTIVDYNNAILKASTYEEAIAIFDNLPDRIQPDAGTFTLLMKKTRDVPTVKRLYSQLIQRKVPISLTTKNQFVAQFSRFDDLLLAIKELDRSILSVRNGTSERLIVLATKDPRHNTAFLFSCFTPDEVFRNPVLSRVCLQCFQDQSDFSNYIQSYLPKADTLDEGLLHNLIRICIKIAKPIGLELIEKYYDQSTARFWEEKGNCLKDEFPLKALDCYEEAFKKAVEESDTLIAKNNYCNLVYEKKLADFLDRALEFARTYSDSNTKEKLVKYLRHIYVLLEIMKCRIEDLDAFLPALVEKPGIANTLIKVISRINDPERKAVVLRFAAQRFPNKIPGQAIESTDK